MQSLPSRAIQRMERADRESVMRLTHRHSKERAVGKLCSAVVERPLTPASPWLFMRDSLWSCGAGQKPYLVHGLCRTRNGTD